MDCGNEDVEEALQSMQRRFHESFNEIAGYIDQAAQSLANASYSSTNVQLLSPILMQAEELWSEKSAKAKCLKLLSDCTNIRCNLLQRLSERFASIKGGTYYRVDLDRWRAAEEALWK